MKHIGFKTWSIPFALLFFIVIGYGLLITSLGFYQDDWYLVWMGQRNGPQVYISFFKGSRPFLAGVYILTTQLVGTSPLAWQIFGLLTRWLAVLTAWWSMRLLWPNRLKEVTWIALILAIYPAFKQHFVSVVYSNAYIALAAYFFSIGAMIYAIRKPRWRWVMTILGLLMAIFSLVTTEYFFGLELFRPLVLWFVFSEQSLAWKERLKKTFLHWSPYLAMTMIFLIWRLFFFSSYMYGPKMLENLATNPEAEIFNLFQTIIQDALEASIFAWLQTLDFAKVIYPDLRQWLISWGIAVAAGALAAFYLLRLRTDTPEKSGPVNKDPFGVQATVLGIYSTLITGWPFWFAGLQVELSGGFDRFTLAYMFGSAILVVGLLDLLVKNDRAKIILIGILVGGAVLFQIRNAQTYQYAHQVQAGLFRDLVWRAPGLQPGARLLINDVPADYTGNASMDAAFNWVYSGEKPDAQDVYRLYYLPFKLGSPEMPSLAPGDHTERSLVAQYVPPGCVQIMDPQVHKNLPRLEDVVRQAMPLSDLAQIEPDNPNSSVNFSKLFGQEKGPDWCYYFEKADLARQLGDWAEVVRLGDTAFATGLKPRDKFSTELLPFIEGYGRIERWDEALKFTQAAKQDIPAMSEILCDTWKRIKNDTPDTTQRDDAINRLGQIIECAIP